MLGILPPQNLANEVPFVHVVKSGHLNARMATSRPAVQLLRVMLRWAQKPAWEPSLPFQAQLADIAHFGSHEGCYRLSAL